MTAKRYHDLDALRAVAMLLGIVLHGMLSFVGWLIWPVQDASQSELYGIPVMFIHGFRMSLFFRKRILYHDDAAPKGHGRVVGSSVQAHCSSLFRPWLADFSYAQQHEGFGRVGRRG